MREGAVREFAEIELLEYRGQGESALERYEALARSTSLTVRAGALLRVARVHRREGRVDAALAANRCLASINEVSIEGMPADLLARRTICVLLEEAGRSRDVAREAEALAADFAAGRGRSIAPHGS